MVLSNESDHFATTVPLVVHNAIHAQGGDDEFEHAPSAVGNAFSQVVYVRNQFFRNTRVPPADFSTGNPNASRDIRQVTSHPASFALNTNPTSRSLQLLMNSDRLAFFRDHEACESAGVDPSHGDSAARVFSSRFGHQSVVDSPNCPTIFASKLNSRLRSVAEEYLTRDEQVASNIGAVSESLAERMQGVHVLVLEDNMHSFPDTAVSNHSTSANISAALSYTDAMRILKELEDQNHSGRTMVISDLSVPRTVDRFDEHTVANGLRFLRRLNQSELVANADIIVNSSETDVPGILETNGVSVGAIVAKKNDPQQLMAAMETVVA